MNTVKRVYDLIEERSITLYQLSQVSGVSYSTVKTTEKRGGQLKVDTIERICEALGITMSEFFQEASSSQSTTLYISNCTATG